MASKLDEYVIQRRLAPALFGDVLLCVHAPSGERVAVKRVLLSAARAQVTLATHKKVREDVALERALGRRLNLAGGHRHVLRLRDELEFDGYLYLVSDFCAKGELYELVSAAPDGKLPVRTVQRYTAQIADAVRFLHAQGFAHRDLSLENVLVTDADACQVCDFGLAASTAQPCSETVGKLFYMAPEVLAGTAYDAARADVWSLGVMLFIMLVGAPPVETASSADARFRLIANKGVGRLLERWGLTDELPAAGMDLLAGMLHVDPAQRLSMAQVVAHPFLQGFVGPQIVESAEKRPRSVDTERAASQPASLELVETPRSRRGLCRTLLHKLHALFSRRARSGRRVMATQRGGDLKAQHKARRMGRAA